MLEIEYLPEFVRTFKKLSPELQIKVKKVIILFKDRNNHSRLKVHKLKGAKRDLWSFSISFKHRIIFRYVSDSKRTAQLLDIGDHSVYE